jgi:hypothetical protein
MQRNHDGFVPMIGEHEMGRVEQGPCVVACIRIRKLPLRSRRADLGFAVAGREALAGAAVRSRDKSRNAVEIA